LIDFQRVARDVEARALDVGVVTVVPADSRREDIDRILTRHAIHVPELSLRPDRLALTGALNQIPTELLFQDGVLVGQRLGPQSYEELQQWLSDRVSTRLRHSTRVSLKVTGFGYGPF
jgi:hypothetical protein